MSEDKTEAGYIRDPGEAYVEAKVIQEIYAPLVKDTVSESAAREKDNSVTQEIAKKMGDTGYLELGSQVLDQVRVEQPRLYDAIISEQDAIARYARADVARWAASGSVDKPVADLELNARKSAISLIEGAARDANHEIINDTGIEPDEDYEMGTQRIVNEKIAERLHDTSTKWISPAARGALVQGVWSYLDIIREQATIPTSRSSDLPDDSPVIGFKKAIEKHNNFNNSQRSVSQPTPSPVK